MKLSVNHSEALLDLLRKGAVQLDAVEWVDMLSLTQIAQARVEFPELAFHFHPGRAVFSERGIAHLQSYLSACPESPHLSIHLAPLPTLWTYPALRWDIFLPGPNAKSAVKRFIAQVKALKARFDIPVILENMPALRPTVYPFENEPAVIRQVLEETGCRLLLDIAHARIAADVRGLSAESYLTALPLEQTAQIHMAGVRRTPQGRLYDAHEPLGDEDYRLLGWCLQRAQPDWLTLEYFKENTSALLEQIGRLRQYL